MMHFLRRVGLSFLGLGLVVVASSRAQTEPEPLVAGRATVALTLTVAQTIGGYALTPAKQESEALKAIDYDLVMDPLNFDADAAGFSYFSERRSEVKKRLADGEIYPVERITQISRKVLTQRYLTGDFIKDLIVRGGVLAESPGDALAWKGYGLVAVTFKGFDEDRRFFFAEKKGKTPVFLGWEKRPEEAAALTAGMCFFTEMISGAAESRTQKTSQRIVYETIRDDGFVLVSEDIFNEPAPTVTETFSGKAALAVRIFPGGTGPFRDLRVTGKATYSGRYDNKRGIYLNGKMSGGGLAGSQFITTGTGATAEALPKAMVEGTFTIEAEALLKTEAEAQVYWLAVPEALRP